MTDVASTQVGMPSCHRELCTEVAVAQPEVVRTSAGPDLPATLAVASRTVPPDRWVVIWIEEVRTTTA